MVYRVFLLFLFFLLSLNTMYAQPTVVTPGNEADNAVLTLDDCIRYAIKNQPAINQSLIDERIAHSNNVIAFSSWLPQVSGAAGFQHYFQLPTAFSNFNGTPTAITTGVYNRSAPQVNATQTIFNSDVFLAARASKLNTKGARLNTAEVKIAMVAAVSKAFYDLLLSIQQIGVYRDDTARLRKNQSDAYHRYVSGIVDKVDYKQATIALNNSLTLLKTSIENVDARYAKLKQWMGYPADKAFTVRFDTAQMMQVIYTDTQSALQFEKRIEYQQLETLKRIQHETTAYYKMGFLPSLSGYYNYVHEFQNNKFADLYGHGYPYSNAGLQLNIPIFSGFRRTENIRKAELQEQRSDWDEVNLKLVIYAEYKQALANYKSNLYNLWAQRENVEMAREVYNIVKLQYSEGIKVYLDVIVAESDLQTSEINYLNALFHLLESKVDLEKARGDIPSDI